MNGDAGQAMGESRANPALRRKAGATRREQEARTPSAARALRRGLAGAAQGRLHLALSVASVTEEMQDQEGLVAALDETGLVLLLEGKDGRAGAAVLGGALVAGLVQHQTTGRVTDPPAEVRRCTDTDAAIVAPLVEGMLDRARGELAEGPDAGWTEGLRFGARLDGLRALALALQAPVFRLFRLTGELAGSVCRGEIALALPEPPPPVADRAPAPAADLAAAAAAAPVELQAILHRLSMPLAEVGTLTRGRRLTLPSAALGAVELRAPGGPTVTAVRLGQIDGMRAVRLPGPAPEDQATPALALPDEEARGASMEMPATEQQGGAPEAAVPDGPTAPDDPPALLPHGSDASSERDP